MERTLSFPLLTCCIRCPEDTILPLTHLLYPLWRGHYPSPYSLVVSTVEGIIHFLFSLVGITVERIIHFPFSLVRIIVEGIIHFPFSLHGWDHSSENTITCCNHCGEASSSPSQTWTYSYIDHCALWAGIYSVVSSGEREEEHNRL